MKSFAILMLLVFCHAVPAIAADPQHEVDQLLKKGRRDLALEQVDAFLQTQPKDAWGRSITRMRMLKGVLLAEQKRTDEAIVVFVRLTQDYPDLPEPYNNLAVLYAAQGRLEDARDALEQAMRTDPGYAAAYRNLNEIYTRLSTQAYSQTLDASKGGQPAPALIKDLCDNYGRMARQSVGRQQSGHGEVSMLRDIPRSRSSAGAPPSKVDIDEMAMPDMSAGSQLPPTFINPAAKPASQPPVEVTEAKTDTADTKLGKIALGDEKEISAAVRSWAKAWSSKNAGAYLASYSRDFRVPDGRSRPEWEKLRRERIAKPRSIRVTLEGVRVVSHDDTQATVSFRQVYRSAEMQATTRKTLVMVKQGGKWLIREERNGP